tara:strand:+ start:585 stop:1070 length:486 start_codon:yes stop_codon:yes gene_type:complete
MHTVSLLNKLKLCNKTLELLYSIVLLCNISDNDYIFLKKRKEEYIENNDIKEFLSMYSFNLGNILQTVDKNIDTLNSVEELENLNITLNNFYDKWEFHICTKKIDMSNLVKTITEIESKMNIWKTYLEEEEDRGSTSSYSDYSGDSTQSSDYEQEKDDESS